jgi:hypothetical protein
MTPSKGKPGDIGWLYGETEESTQGRQPGTLASLAMHREQRTREALAEMGIPPESAAVSLKAAKAALLKCLPDSKARAMTQDSLFEAAAIPTRTTGQKALKRLLSDDSPYDIQRIGKGGKGDPFRYFLSPAAPALTEGADVPKKRRPQTKAKNEALLALLKDPTKLG